MNPSGKHRQLQLLLENSEGDNLVPSIDEQPPQNNVTSWASSESDSDGVNLIEELDFQLLARFNDRLRVEPAFARQDVSFQGSKEQPVYRWFKYKEAFSASLVKYLLRHHQIRTGRLLDPFAGSGTSLFGASELGLDADGIELLPIGQSIIFTRLMLERKFTKEHLATLQRWATERPWLRTSDRVQLPHVRITEGAYPPETVANIERYLAAIQRIEAAEIRAALFFALLCTLESISYTRKDGQYLRWDHRSGRRENVKPFNKGPIKPFDQAISDKLNEMVYDLSPLLTQSLWPNPEPHWGAVNLHLGSCLNILPTLPPNHFDCVITSPPYCNRYDYTRTYALELALLGVQERDLASLRQDMLSCTVENRAKDLLTINPTWNAAIRVADNNALLQAILKYLEEQKALGTLNNNGIPRMVRGYFYEMCCAITECGRVLKAGSHLFMVNDNVRYAGVSISVDTILASMAEEMGFRVANILTLPSEKGNSSQQMGKHGRDGLRKSVYVWRKI
jgi:DNA modification methylase